MDDSWYTKALLGKDARHVPCWMYVQNQGGGVVSFVGASRTAMNADNPLMYDNERTHKFIVGEIVVRPHYVIGTDVLRGMGLDGLASSSHDIDRMLTQGEYIIGGIQ